MRRILLFFACLLLLLLTSCYEATELNDYVLTIVDNGPLASNDYQHVITIESNGKFSDVYYTLDNSTPNADSTKYTPAEYKCTDSKTYSGILVSEGETIKAKAISGNENSFITEKNVTFKCKIGDKGPAGGYIFYDCDADNGSGNADGLTSIECGWRYLEVAPEDSEILVPFGNFGDSGTSELIGTGKTNTETFVAENGNDDYATKVCSNYSLNGYDDWFLPSKDELNLLYQNLKDKMGSFDYWSSSEVGYDCAWSQSFNTGKQTECNRSLWKQVRPVRAYTNSEKHTHSWNSGVDTLLATCNAGGKRTYTCLICGKTREESISATGIHTYVNYRCSGCGLWGKGPAGGYVFYDCDADNDSGNVDGLVSTVCGWRYLEAAPENRQTLYGFGYNRSSESASNLVVGTSTAIGSGKANTNALVEALHDSAYELFDGASKDAYAALICYGFSWLNDDDEVFDDWFLPSLEELNLMYENLHKNGLGDFEYAKTVNGTTAYCYSYWSSSEYNETEAWCFIFTSNPNYKDVRQHSSRGYTNVVRPIRAFKDEMIVNLRTKC